MLVGQRYLNDLAASKRKAPVDPGKFKVNNQMIMTQGDISVVMSDENLAAVSSAPATNSRGRVSSAENDY